MSNTRLSPETMANPQDVLDIEPTEVIYADKVISGGFGPQVSRIQLGMERGNGKVSPTACIVLPTASIVALLTSALTALKDEQLLAQIRHHVTKIEADLATIQLTSRPDEI
ncbi:hypothetical protein [Achromobacter mucicolens]|uniref:hypothetical protein n=1 Tax=Achromobacter mucicolens TaxID=1389922 RepID=UPI002FE18749